jgi:hypothetical protein
LRDRTARRAPKATQVPETELATERGGGRSEEGAERRRLRLEGEGRVGGGSRGGGGGREDEAVDFVVGFLAFERAGTRLGGRRS